MHSSRYQKRPFQEGPVHSFWAFWTKDNRAVLIHTAAQVLYGINQRMRVEDVDSPLLDVRPVKTILLVAVTGDRGLCGGYNNQVIKKVMASTAIVARVAQ